MIKSTLFISLGGCGAKLLNELIDINPSINGVFVNSNINEMRKLSHFDIESGNYLAINGKGTARQRQKSMASLEKDKLKVMEFINNTVGNYNTYVLIFSCDGGFGSGSFPLFSKAIKNLNKRAGYDDIAVNIIGVFPKVNSRKLNLQNTIEAYNDIVDLNTQGFINSYQFINNDRMEDINEFNKSVMEDINSCYNIENIELDTNDSMAINNCSGYKVVLNLDYDSFDGELQDAISYAQQTSNFLLPQNIGYATHIGISFIEDEFDIYEALDSFNVSEFDKEDYNNENNIILLGGCNPPIEAIKEYEEALLNINNNPIKEQVYKSDITVKKKPVKKAETNKKQLTKNDLRDMLDDLW